MSSFTSRIAGQFASSPGGGNKATASFFIDMALIEVKAALAFLDRAERDCPGVVDVRTRTDADILIHHLAMLASRSREHEQIRRPMLSEDEFAVQHG